jgi:hypothetical protein
VIHGLDRGFRRVFRLHDADNWCASRISRIVVVEVPSDPEEALASLPVGEIGGVPCAGAWV